MKFFIVSLAFLALAAADVGPQVAILKQTQDISPDGSYDFNYETENGISHSENGVPAGLGPHGEPVVIAQGQYQYTAPDGTPIAVRYSADNNGFQAQGAHLPQAHPVPELIQRALEYIAAHPPPPEHQ